MKIVAASDLHGNLPAIEDCDVAVLAGDVAPCDDHDVAWQRRWFAGPFVEWLESGDCAAGRVVMTGGNHDFALELGASCCLPDKVIYLQDSGAVIGGLKFYGTPWTWRKGLAIRAFGLPEKHRKGRADLRKAFGAIPDDVDVLVTHNPPARFGDQAVENVGGMSATFRLVHLGSPSLLYRIEEVGPRLAVFGHVHEAHGRWEHEGTILANVSLLDENYQVAHRPQVFEI